MKPLLPAAAVAGLLLWAGAALLTPRADAEHARARCEIRGTPVDVRADSLHGLTVPRSGYFNPEDEPWFIDAPAAEQNLSRRVRTVTAIQVNDPVVLTLEDPNLWSYPGSTSSSPATCA